MKEIKIRLNWIKQSKRLVWKTFVGVVLFFDSLFSDIGQSNDTSWASVSLHGKGNCTDTEVLGFFVSHVCLVVSIAISVNEPTAWSAHGEFSFQSGSSQIDWINLRTFVWVPTGNNVSCLQLFFIIYFLEHSCCCQNMGQFSLLNTVGVDKISDFVGGLLGLSSGSTSQNADVLVNVIDLVGNSIDSVNTTGGGSWD